MRAAGLITQVTDQLTRMLVGLARATDEKLARTGLVPHPLELPQPVREELATLFGDSIDLDQVIIRVGHLPGISHRRAFALPGVVYTGADPGMVLGPPPHHLRSQQQGFEPAWRATPTLVHELVHIWQAEHRGYHYLWESLWDQLRLGSRAYQWRHHLELAGWPVDGWDGLPVEAQAQFIGDVYAGSVTDRRGRRVAQHAFTVLRGRNRAIV